MIWCTTHLAPNESNGRRYFRSRSTSSDGIHEVVSEEQIDW